MNATDLGVMCIGAAYPSMGIELADSRDNEGQPSQETDGTDTDLGGETAGINLKVRMSRSLL